MRIAKLCLRVNKVPDLIEFYTRHIGMRVIKNGTQTVLAFDEPQCMLALHQGDFEAYEPHDQDLYWKMGITLKNLDAAVVHLRDLGYPVSDPHQFRDIGYMAHLRDPQGFLIELLQIRPKGSETIIEPVAHPIGGQATLAHISLRTTDIEASQKYFEVELKMRLLSVQPVQDLNFTLYFYSWSDEALPDKNILSVKNREWLWARPYPLIEIQHIKDTPRVVRKPCETSADFAGITIQCPVTGEKNLSAISIFELGSIKNTIAS